MMPIAASAPSRLYYPDALQRMYDSPYPLNEGLLSFEYPLYRASDEELDYFLGSVIHSVSKAAAGVAKTVGKGISAVNKVVPTSVLTSTLSWTPMGMAARAGLGALQAAGEGRNVFQGAFRSLAADPVSRFYIDTAAGAVRGENILKSAQKAAQAGIGDLRQSLQFAAMVAPFVPGVGTGVAAALGAANALAAGEPITDALVAAARSAIPGGAAAQFAFDTAINLAKGKRFDEALLNSARGRIPGGPAAQAAFDAALALAKGKNIQDAAFAAAGRLLPKSPYTTDALSFVRKVANGENVQRAALSAAGNVILNRVQAMGGPAIPRLVRIPRVPALRHELPEFENGGSQADLYKRVDAIFFQRHPELGGRRIRPDETALRNEWMSILRSLSGTPSPAPVPARDADVAAAQLIASKAVPGVPGATIQQFVEPWRARIAPEIPMAVLIAFMRYESGGNFGDATHGSKRSNYTSPEFYELGIFQTPAGLHGTCQSGDHHTCAFAPPGREKPGDPSTWAKLCKRIGANPQDWTNPATQVQVGLLDLKTNADAIRAAYPELFPAIGSDWYLRMAVLMPFARGGGYSRAFLSAYRSQLSQLPEDRRWDLLRGKHAGHWTFDPANVDEKMTLAAKLGYQPRSGPSGT
jgi:hypothetical protein